jgi:ATP-dependent Clp protease ATP-binding subunit ClpA
VDLAQLTQAFAEQGGGSLGQLLGLMDVDLTSYPAVPEPPRLAEDALRALDVAVATSGGQVNTGHLLIGVLEVGGGALGRALAGSGFDLDELVARLREAVPEAPEPAQEPILSPNTRRLLSAATDRALRKNRSEATVDDLVKAAIDTGAGLMGRVLRELVGLDSDGSGEEGPASPVPLDEGARRMWELAAACGQHCERPLVGSPQLLAAALHGHEPLRQALQLQGLEAEDILASLLEALGLPREARVFEPLPDATPPVTHNVHRALAAAAARAGERGAAGPQDILLALLANEDAEAHRLLERLGVHVGLLREELAGQARALEPPDEPPPA